MNSFGASPIADLYEHFGIAATLLVQRLNYNDALIPA